MAAITEVERVEVIQYGYDKDGYRVPNISTKLARKEKEECIDFEVRYEGGRKVFVPIL